MPHQCLGCGHAFEEGSSELLAGCPKCRGTRFFYTAALVSEEERRSLQQRAQRDLREVVAEILQDAAPETARELSAKADADGWAELTPRDLRRLVKKVQAETQRNPADDEPVDSARRRAAAAEAWAQLQAESAAAAEEDAHPDTVNIRGAGEYDIDVKALLERNPIVVHKDGAYLIHLPSLFQQQ